MRSDEKIYLSWGGEIYGPSSLREIKAGIRASSFEDGAVYWHEGMEKWKPLAEFPFSEEPPRGNLTRVNPEDLPVAPALPVAEHRRSSEQRVRRRGPSRTAPEEPGLGKQAAVIAYAVLAVAVTVAVLLLLMLV